MDITVDLFDNESQDQPKFMEAYQSCSQTFIGGSTFMDLCWQDEYAEECCKLISYGLEHW